MPQTVQCQFAILLSAAKLKDQIEFFENLVWQRHLANNTPLATL
jgi:hypothetical protein